MLRTLKEWRELPLGEPTCAAWEQFRPFLDQQGYKLFERVELDWTNSIALKPPAGCSTIRAEDCNSLFLPESLNIEPQPSLFVPRTGIHSAARSPSNTDVVIRIIAIGNDGQEHLDILRALAAPDAQVPENRTVPMIAELKTGDFVLGVFPLLWPEAMSNPWFETVRQVLDALDQVLEGFTYLHRRLIAHRDFAMKEVFSNYGRGWDSAKHQPPCLRIPPTLRSCCPDMRYMINDLELSVQFASDSLPSTRVVMGNPIERYGYPAKEYGKYLGPEANRSAPYCPFKADMYQLGKSALDSFRFVQAPGLRRLLGRMTSKDPEMRPTAAQALAELRNIRLTAPEEVIDDVPVDQDHRFRRLAPNEICTCSRCARTKLRKVPFPLTLNRVPHQQDYCTS